MAGLQIQEDYLETKKKKTTEEEKKNDLF